jgi:hypothetical protein
MLKPYPLARRTNAEYRPSINPPFYPNALTAGVDFLDFAFHFSNLNGGGEQWKEKTIESLRPFYQKDYVIWVAENA